MKLFIQWLGIIAASIAGNLVFLFAIGIVGLSEGQDDTASQFAGWVLSNIDKLIMIRR